MARLPDYDMSKAAAPFQATMKARHAGNIYKLLPYAGRSGEAFLVMGEALLREGVLDPRLRELVVIRVGHLCGAAYEIHQHTRIGRKVGLTEAQMSALAINADQSILTERERLALRFTDEVVRQVKASDQLFEQMLTQFNAHELAELLMLIGYYMLVSRFLENLEVEIEAPPATAAPVTVATARFEHQSHSFAWRADSFKGPQDYSVHLDDEDRAQLMRVVEDGADWVGQIAQAQPDRMPLQFGDNVGGRALEAKLAEASRRVAQGPGFVVLRGLPTEGVTLEQYSAVVWAIGQRFGEPLSQNASGERLTYVIDATGVDPTPRMYRSNLELRPHTDITAMISLAGWNRGASGGATVLASGVTVHDEIRKRAPHLLERLYKGYHYHRLGEEGEGEEPTTERRAPVFSNRNGQISVRYLRTGIAAGQSARGEPLSATDLEALNLFDSISTAPENRLAFYLERGEMIVANNYTTMHARTKFVSDPAPGKERRLVRLWLDRPGFRDVPAEYNFYKTNGVPRAEGKRANFDFKKLYANDPIATGGVPDMKVVDSDLGKA